MFEKGDSTGRPLREVQKTAFKWLSDNWFTYKFFAIQAPTGSGKSLIAKAILDEMSRHKIRAAYLSPNNVLIDQITSTYPSLNSLIGAEHYRCKENPDMSCQERSREVGHWCEDCLYRTCIRRAIEGEATAFNPLSYWYMQMREGWEWPEVLVIDEAHSLVECIKTLVSFKLPKSKYKYPEGVTNALELMTWSAGLIEKLKKIMEHADTSSKTANQAVQNFERLTRMHDLLANYQHEYSIYHTKDKDDGDMLVLEPLNISGGFMREFLKVKKVILLSATLTHYSVEQIVAGDKYIYLDLPSPIPAEQRPVHFRPSNQPMNYRTPASYLAQLIDKVRAEFPGNCICHTTYAVAESLRPYFPDAFIHTKTTKKSTLQKFKKHGGLWIAAGCDEGIDLVGDFCRTNIILRLPRANSMDISIAKRKALAGGQEWYDIQTLIKTIQQAGRSTRKEEDYSAIVICDPGFKPLVLKYQEQLPKSFLESIHWR